jgi:hypothetical protein
MILVSSGQVHVKGDAQRIVLTYRIDMKSAKIKSTFAWMVKRNFCCETVGGTHYLICWTRAIEAKSKMTSRDEIRRIITKQARCLRGCVMKRQWEGREEGVRGKILSLLVTGVLR